MTKRDGRGRTTNTKIYGGVSVGKTTLVPPVTMTTGPDVLGLSIITAATPLLSQQAIQFQGSSGTPLWTVGVVGGPKTSNGTNVQAYHAPGGSWAGFVGAAPACLQLPDGTSNQGSKVFSGSGAPSTLTLGSTSVSAGDVYYQRSVSQLIASTNATAGTYTSITVGSGTPATGSNYNLSGTPQIGDLVIVVSNNTNSSETMTIGGTSGVTATSADGGYTANDGTRYVKMYSHIVQPGDISSSNITITSSTHTTGTGRKLMAFVFRASNPAKQGTATGSTSTPTSTLTDSTASFPTSGNGLIGCVVLAGSSVGLVTANTSTSVTVASWAGGTPSSSSPYTINAGWPQTGSKHGCSLAQSNSATYSLGATLTNKTLSVTGPSTYPNPSVVVTAEYSSASSNTIYQLGVVFDAGNLNGSLDAEVPASYSSDYCFAQSKPGNGTNSSAAVGYPVGGSTCAWLALSGNVVLSMGMWQPAVSPFTSSQVNPVMWTCTVGGSPGTWVKTV